MTKAERIYKETRFDCLRHVRDGFYQENEDGSAAGFTGLTCKDDETVSIRTINTVEKLLISAKRLLATDVKLGVMDSARAEREERVLKMVESTLNNNRKRIQAFNDEMKRI